jgi:hypothetical protein
MLSTLRVSNESAWLNALAPLNKRAIEVTLLVSHPRGSSKLARPANKSLRSETAVTSQ